MLSALTEVLFLFLNGHIAVNAFSAGTSFSRQGCHHVKAGNVQWQDFRSTNPVLATTTLEASQAWMVANITLSIPNLALKPDASYGPAIKSWIHEVLGLNPGPGKILKSSQLSWTLL